MERKERKERKEKKERKERKKRKERKGMILMQGGPVLIKAAGLSPREPQGPI